MAESLPFSAVVLVLVASSLSSSGEAASTGLAAHGLDMAATAFNSICYYEYFRLLPEGEKDPHGYAYCAAIPLDDLKKMSAGSPEVFANIMNQMGMDKLPKEYGKTCKKFLSNVNLKEESSTNNEGDVLNDSNSKDAYGLKGFAYCLMSTLRKRRGDNASENLKKEVTHNQDWRLIALTKDNELRARHGVEPFQRLPALDKAAQAFAQKMADNCNDEDHSSDKERLYNGHVTGENIFSYGGSGGLNPVIAPINAVTDWYSESEHYPFPNGCGEGGCADVVEHFTQTVWKGTKFVGYGMAFNANCPEGKSTTYFAGRYYPAGNLPEAQKANVLPPKSH